MRPVRIFAIVLRQFYLYRGSVARLLPMFIWVAIDMLLWGFMSRYLNSISPVGFNFVPALLGAILLWDFFGRVMQGVTMAFFEDVWSRNFLNMFATPLSITEYVSGLVVSSIITSALGLAVMIVMAGSIFGLRLFAYGVLLAPFVLVLFLFGIALGIAATALVLRLGPAAEWFIWPIPAMISPFVGVMYPISVLPAWMRWISRVLPPAYVFESMRAIIAGRSVPVSDLLIAVVLAVVAVGLAGLFFTSVYRRALRTGLLARYSAESVS